MSGKPSRTDELNNQHKCFKIMDKFPRILTSLGLRKYLDLKGKLSRIFWLNSLQRLKGLGGSTEHIGVLNYQRSNLALKDIY